ncbi:MAG: hypothetical protein C7B43_21275, partial [Sulfobacillus benefaciens]
MAHNAISWIRRQHWLLTMTFIALGFIMTGLWGHSIAYACEEVPDPAAPGGFACSTTGSSTTQSTGSSAASTSGTPTNNSNASAHQQGWHPANGYQQDITHTISTTTQGFQSAGTSGQYTYNGCASQGAITAYNASTNTVYCDTSNTCPAGEKQINNDGVCQGTGSDNAGTYAQWTFSACVNGTQTEYSHNVQTDAVTSTSQVNCVPGSQSNTSSSGDGGNTAPSTTSTSTTSPSTTTSTSTSTGGSSGGGGYVPTTTGGSSGGSGSACHTASTNIQVRHVYTNGTIVTVTGTNLPTLTGLSSTSYGSNYRNFLWSQSNLPSVVNGDAVGNTMPYDPDWGIAVLRSTSTELKFIPADNNGQSLNPPTGTWYLYLSPAGGNIGSSPCALWSGSPGAPPAVTVKTHTITNQVLSACMPNPVLTTYRGQTIQPPTNDNWV